MKLAVILFTLCYIACTYAQSNCANELTKFKQCLGGKVKAKSEQLKNEKVAMLQKCFTSNGCTAPTVDEIFCSGDECVEEKPTGKPRGLSTDQKACIKQVFMDSVRNKLEECTGDLPDWMFDSEKHDIMAGVDKPERVNQYAIRAAVYRCPASMSCVLSLKDGGSDQSQTGPGSAQGKGKGKGKGKGRPGQETDTESEDEIAACNAFNECMDKSFISCKQEAVKATSSICGCIDGKENGNQRANNLGKAKGGSTPFPRDFNQDFFACITPAEVQEARRIKRDINLRGMKLPQHAAHFCKCQAQS